MNNKDQSMELFNSNSVGEVAMLRCADNHYAGEDFVCLLGV